MAGVEDEEVEMLEFLERELQIPMDDESDDEHVLLDDDDERQLIG